MERFWGGKGSGKSTNLKENEKFESPIITPTTKEDYGLHDQPISKDEIINQGLVDKHVYELAENYALQLFQRGQEWADKMGLILVDTKYEFGILDEKLIVIDEIHTPDSSRYWIMNEYEKRFSIKYAELFLWCFWFVG